MQHTLNYRNHENVSNILDWLEENIQPNYRENQERYNFSTIGQFIEWRSQDLRSWIMRVSGTPPKIHVEISRPEHNIMFILKWL